MWNAANTVLRGKFVALDLYIGNEELSQINNLSSYYKKTEKSTININKMEGGK
jgi:hypothetical protein